MLVAHDHLSMQRPMCRGSIPRHTPALNHNRESEHFLLWKDYFDTTNPLFKHQKFCRRFRMSRHVFNHIRKGVVGYDDYFECKEDAVGKIGFSSYQKLTCNCKMIWLSICEIMLATNRCIFFYSFAKLHENYVRHFYFYSACNKLCNFIRFKTILF